MNTLGKEDRGIVGMPLGIPVLLARFGSIVWMLCTNGGSGFRVIGEALCEGWKFDLLD